MNIIEELNSLSNQVWAALFIIAGTLLYLNHERDGAMALVSGGFAVMQHKQQ